MGRDKLGGSLPACRTVLAGSPRHGALQCAAKRSSRLSGRRSRRMVSNDEHGRFTFHRKVADFRLRPDFPQHARGGHENCQGGHDVVWHSCLLLLCQKVHGDALSVADWIRLSRLGDDQSPRRCTAKFVHAEALLSLSGGWLSLRTAESSRLLSLPDGKEIE
jgi:hypothetical protein